MITVKVQLDEKTIAEAQRILRGIPKAWPKVARHSLVRTLNSARTQLSRLVKARLKKAKAGDIKKLIYCHYPSYARLIGTLEVSKLKSRLIDLAAQQTPEGVTYQPSVGGGRQLLRHAFIATGDVRKRQVWLRSRFHIGHVKTIQWKGRLMEAIYIQREPGISRFLKTEDMAAVKNTGAENLVKNLKADISYELKKWAKR